MPAARVGPRLHARRGHPARPGPGLQLHARTPTTISPGVYYGGIVISGQAQVQFNPGVYSSPAAACSTRATPFSRSKSIGGTRRQPGPRPVLQHRLPELRRNVRPGSHLPAERPSPVRLPGRRRAPSVPADEWLDQAGAAGTYTLIAETRSATRWPTPRTWRRRSIRRPGTTSKSRLATIVPPIPDSGIFVRYRYGMLAGSDAAIDLEVELLKGTTIIANQVKQDIQAVAGWQVGEFELTTADLAEIGTDWTDLRLNFKATATTPGADDRGQSCAGQLGAAPDSRDRVAVLPGHDQARRSGRRGGLGDRYRAVGRPALLAGRHARPGNGDGEQSRRDDRRSGQRRHEHRRHDLCAASAREDHGQRASDAEPDVAAVQVLAWQFTVGGNGVLNMPYDPDQFFGTPQTAQKGLVE